MSKSYFRKYIHLENFEFALMHNVFTNKKIVIKDVERNSIKE